MVETVPAGVPQVMAGTEWVAWAGEPVDVVERESRAERGEPMIHGDATAAALAAALDEEEAAEERAARAGHALAEAEERAEEDPAAAGLEACRQRLAAAEERLAELRERRRDLEARLGEGEALRVHAGRGGCTPDAR